MSYTAENNLAAEALDSTHESTYAHRLPTILAVELPFGTFAAAARLTQFGARQGLVVDFTPMPEGMDEVPVQNGFVDTDQLWDPEVSGIVRHRYPFDVNGKTYRTSFTAEFIPGEHPDIRDSFLTPFTEAGARKVAQAVAECEALNSENLRLQALAADLKSGADRTSKELDYLARLVYDAERLREHLEEKRASLLDEHYSTLEEIADNA